MLSVYGDKFLSSDSLVNQRLIRDYDLAAALLVTFSTASMVRRLSVRL